MNDFHHIKHYPVVPDLLNATEKADYQKGYQAGWNDAKVNGTSLDPTCYTGSVQTNKQVIK